MAYAGALERLRRLMFYLAGLDAHHGGSDNFLSFLETWAKHLFGTIALVMQRNTMHHAAMNQHIAYLNNLKAWLHS